MNNTIKIVVKEPDKVPEVREVVDTLETYQKLVGGYIEAVRFAQSREILLVINEEGKIHGLKPNFKWYNDIIVGTAVFVGNDAPDFRGLTDEEVNFILASFK